MPHKNPAAHLSRRSLLSSLAAGAALAAMPHTPALAAPVKLAVSHSPVLDAAPFVIANKQGYFTEQDIAVTSEPLHSGAVGIPALIAGSYDVIYSNAITALIAMGRGLDLRIIAESAPMVTQPPYPGGLVTRKGEPIKTGKDLEGRQIGVTNLNGMQWLVVRAWAKKYGGDPDKIIFREVGHPQAVDAIKSKQVDADLVLDPFFTASREDPTLELVGWPFETMAGYPTAYWLVTAETAEKRADVVSRFLKAYRKGVDWNNANMKSDAYLEMVSSYTRVKPDLLKKLAIAPPSKTVEVGSSKKLMALMREHKLLDSEFDIAPKIFPQSA